MPPLRTSPVFPACILIFCHLSLAGEARLPLPTQESRDEAMARLEQTYGAELRQRDRQALLRLAKNLLAHVEAEDNSEAMRYVLLQRTAELASRSGDAETALKAVKTIGRRYDAPTLRMRMETLEELEKSADSPAAYVTVAIRYMKLAHDALRADDFEVAQDAATKVHFASRKSKNDDLAEASSELRKLVHETRKAYRKIQDALATLRDDPDDPEANGLVGHYHCLFKNCWEKGLPYLAKGDDEKLAPVATVDANRPELPEAFVVVADAYFDLAQAEEEASPPRVSLLSRALYYYAKAFPASDGLVKAKIEKRIAAAEKEVDAERLVLGMQAEGNVALAENGAVAKASKRANLLIDGNARRYTGGKGYAHGHWAKQDVFEVALAHPYALRLIRFLLWDMDGRFYRYQLFVSPDGESWEMLADRSKGQWRGWQVFELPSRPVKAIRIKGLHNSMNGGFHIVEVEAYCFPPEREVEPNLNRAQRKHKRRQERKAHKPRR